METPEGGLWLFMVGSQGNRLYLAGQLDAAEATYDEARRQLEGSESEAGRRHLAAAYHQLGMVAQDRGDLSAAEHWYRKSLEIEEALGNRPGMAFSYGTLGLLAAAQGNLHAALDWTIRCIALFPQFPHPATGPGPSHLARLAALLGIGTLAASWQRVTGEPLPEAVRRFVEEAAESAGEGASDEATSDQD
ncbi:MAG: tetratricopeptide repeat protein [bacterium]|nr:tetratricopeptide repeat protein [bacterium]